VNINCFFVEYVSEPREVDILVFDGSPTNILVDAANPYITPKVGFTAITGNGEKYTLPLLGISDIFKLSFVCAKDGDMLYINNKIKNSCGAFIFLLLGF
jgi:hypothetical protein